MLNILVSILGIFITIFVVVGVHEFGHFITARLCGIKILRFSIGFGKALYRWYDKKGTEYVIAAIPLGGYIKMLDEGEGPVPENELHLAFNRQPFYKKALVVLAGPAANFILAIYLYWALFVVGFSTVKPVIGTIAPNSIAAQAGLKPHQEILKIDNTPTPSWVSVALHIILRVGDQGTLQVQTQPFPLTLTNAATNDYSLSLTHWQLDKLKPDPLESLGIVPYVPAINPVIDFIQPDSPAIHSGLKMGDTVIAIDKQKIKDWVDVLPIVAKSPGKTLIFTVERQGKKINLPVTVGVKKSFFVKEHGFLGLGPKIQYQPALIKLVQYGPLDAIPVALDEVGTFIQLNTILLGKMITGKVSMQSLGGPITIFESAGDALNQGIIPFLSFLAFLSISIGFINIIPIPGLDGGHLLFQTIEFIIRRPLSERFQVLCYHLGLIFLFLLIAQAVANDIMRL